MEVSSANIKSKPKSVIRSKSKNKMKREIPQKLLKSRHVSFGVKQRNPLIKTMATYAKSIIICYTNYLYNRYCAIMNDFLKWRICTGLTILSSLLTWVKAQSEVEPMEFDDFVVCLPISSNSCITYVNSSLYGYIEINETLFPALKAFRGSYDYQMIARINPFWLSFEPPTDLTYYIMGSFYVALFVVGVSGNGLVIYMFARCKALRTASYILVLNLALSDIMIVTKCPVAAYNNFMRGPALGDWGCRIYGFVGGFSGTASIGMLTIISLDRYSVVVNPLSPIRLSFKSKYYYILLLVVWLDALLFSILPLCEVGLSTYVPEGYLTTCSFDYLDTSLYARVFMFVFFIFAWLIPLVIIFYCYFHILKAVYTATTIQSNKNKQQMEVRLAWIVLLVIGLWFLAWTPYALVAMAGVFGQKEYLTPTRSMIPALFCKTASCFNPFLYTISHKRFRSELQRLFCKRPPVYKFSLTRSSYLTRSTKQSRNRINFVQDGAAGVGSAKSGYKMDLNAYRKSIKSKKMSLDDGQSLDYDGHNYQHNKNQKQPRRSLESPSENNVFVVDIKPTMVNYRMPQHLETNF